MAQAQVCREQEMPIAGLQTAKEAPGQEGVCLRLSPSIFLHCLPSCLSPWPEELLESWKSKSVIAGPGGTCPSTSAGQGWSFSVAFLCIQRGSFILLSMEHFKLLGGLENLELKSKALTNIYGVQDRREEKREVKVVVVA